MIAPMVLLGLAVLASVGLHFAKEDTLTETVCATLAVTFVLAVPVGYLMGSFG